MKIKAEVVVGIAGALVGAIGFVAGIQAKKDRRKARRLYITESADLQAELDRMEDKYKALEMEVQEALGDEAALKMQMKELAKEAYTKHTHLKALQSMHPEMETLQ